MPPFLFGQEVRDLYPFRLRSVIVYFEECFKKRLDISVGLYILGDYPIGNSARRNQKIVVSSKSGTGWGCSSVVEHLPFKQVADGSIPSTLI